MWKLIDNRDLRTLFEGVAGVAAAGLLMGMDISERLAIVEARALFPIPNP